MISTYGLYYILYYSHKVFLYSCHDASLVPILKSLGIFDNRWPPFCATIEFDLLENAKHEKFVKVSYCGEVCNITFSLSPMQQNFYFCKVEQILEI